MVNVALNETGGIITGWLKSISLLYEFGWILVDEKRRMHKITTMNAIHCVTLYSTNFGKIKV